MLETKEVKIIAELYFRDSQEPVKTFLLGEDRAIYFYNNLEHSIKPFGQKGKIRYDFEPSRIEYIINHSLIEYNDGKIEIMKNYFGDKNDRP